MTQTRSAAAPRRRRTTSEQQILEATAALLQAGHRLPDIAVNDIIDAASVSRSTFYQHFSGKSDLAFRLAAPAMKAARTTSDRWWQEPAWGTSQDMVDVVETLMEQARQHRLAWLAVFDIADRDPETAAVMETLVRDYVGQMAARITHQQLTGTTSPTINPALLGRLILVTTRAAILDQLAHGEQGDDAAFSQTLGRMLWLALHDPR